MKLKMQAGLVLVFIASLLSAPAQTSLASTVISKVQTQRALNSIKSEIQKIKQQIIDLENDKETEIANSLKNAQVETREIQSTYDAKMKLATEKKKNTQSRLAELSSFRVTVDNISACGPNFQSRCEKNQVISVPPTASVDVSFLIKLGGFVPLDETAYKNTLILIQEIDAEILKLDSYLPGDKIAIEDRYKKTVSVIYNNYDELTSEKEASLALMIRSQIATTRALKSGGNYLDAFSNAILFEINLQNITEVADTSFLNIDSLLDLTVVQNAVKLSEQGESIKSKYSAAKAKSYNKTFGKIFIDSYYADIVAKTSNIFKKFTK